MRWLSLPLLVAALASSAAADTKGRWTITPPAGWDDATAELLNSPIVAVQRKQVEAGGLRGLDFTLWTADHMAEPFRLLEVLTAHGDAYEQSTAVLLGYAAGLEGSTKSMEQAQSSEAKDPLGLTIETSGITSGQQMYMKSIVGLDEAHHLSTATALCFGAATDCHAALATFVFDRTGYEKVDWSRGTLAGQHSTAGSDSSFETGIWVGGFIGAGLGAFLLLRRRRAT